MKRTIIRYLRMLPRLILVAAIIAAVGWGTEALTGRTASQEGTSDIEGPDVPTAAVRQGSFELTVTATGRLRAHRTMSVITPDVEEAKIVAIAEDGSRIQKGQVICKLDDTTYRRELREETLQYENALAELKRSTADRSLESRNTDAALTKIQEELRILKESNAQLLRQANAQLAFDEANLKRSQGELTKKKRQADERLIPREQVEIAEIDLRAKEFAVDKGKKDLKLQEDKSASTERQKQIELESAQFTSATAQRKTGDEGASLQRRLRHQKRDMEEAREHLERCTIRAPGSGLVVLARFWHRDGSGERTSRVGDQVWARSPLAEIPDLSRMIVVCRIPEQEIGGVRAGAPARVRLEEEPDRVFRAVVTRIGSMAEEVLPWDSSDLEPGTRTFTVTLDLRTAATKQLVPGVTANVEIVAQQIPKAFSVPKQCVFDRGDRYVVYRWVSSAKKAPDRRSAGARPPKGARGRFVAVTVRPGAENGQYVVLRGPLRPGDRVATTRPG